MENNNALHYLDNAATTRVHPAVAAVINETLCHNWGNPSSLYRAGMVAEQAIAAARATLAEALGCAPREVVFTSCGTEASNLAILGAARARKNWGRHLITTGYEHPAVLEPLKMLAREEGFELTVVAPAPDGTVDIGALAAAVRGDTVLASAMHVNNESGAVIDPGAFAAAVKTKNPRTFVHVDGVQGFCKLSVRLSATKVDGYATSGHKLHAPKGVGALYLRAGSHLLPPMQGGGQENGLRPGTENTPYITGYAKAAQLMHPADNLPHLAGLRAQLQQGLAAVGGCTIHSPPNGYPGILLFSLPIGLRSQVVLNLLDEEYGVCVSSGSACSGGAPSHTLSAMGVAPPLIDAALRASFCADTTPADVNALLRGLQHAVGRLGRV